MNNSINLKCWEIMNCANRDCSARSEPETPCWEITKRNVAYHNVSNTCRDCVVYLYTVRFKKETSVLSKKEFQNILRQRALLKNIEAGHQVCILKAITTG
jgi:hypothetical protein